MKQLELSTQIYTLNCVLNFFSFYSAQHTAKKAKRTDLALFSIEEIPIKSLEEIREKKN